MVPIGRSSELFPLSLSGYRVTVPVVFAVMARGLPPTSTLPSTGYSLGWSLPQPGRLTSAARQHPRHHHTLGANAVRDNMATFPSTLVCSGGEGNAARPLPGEKATRGVGNPAGRVPRGSQSVRVRVSLP